MPSTTNGVIWSAIERFSVQGVQFLLTLVIARLVTPGEYGLIAMLSIFMAIAQTFIDSGFGSALIQKKDRTEVDFSTVFYFSIAVSGLCYIILYLCAPLIASFYEEPELVPVTRFVGLNLVLMNLSIIQRTKLSIDLNFKLQTKISLIAVVVSGGLGIWTAYIGWGVWALVIQTLSNNFIQSLLLWIMTKWYPMMLFSLQSFRCLFSFGSKLLLSGLMHTIYLNLYTLVIGKFYNAADVGFYNRAYSISQYPSVNIVTVMSRAIFPVQCNHQDDDDWLEDSFIKYLRMSCFVVFPLTCLLAVIAKPLVLLVLTEKWMPCAILISILSVAYMWYPVMVINNQMLNVKGRSDLFLKAEIIKKIVAVGILIVTLPFGVEWLCIGVLIYNLFDTTLIIWFTKKVIRTGFRMQAKAILPIFLLTAVSAIVSWRLTELSILSENLPLLSLWYTQIIGGSIVFSLIFVAGCKILHIDELDVMLQVVRKIKGETLNTH